MRSLAQRIVVTLIPLAWGISHARPGYLRFPDVHGEMIVFTAEGDLWLARTDGTDVRRITSHPGDELHARFSPDGAWLVFSGEYDGNRDIYVMPSTGGEPRRLTWHPGPDEPIDWTPDGTRILFTSRRESPHRESEVYAIPLDGGEPEKVPIGPAISLAVEPETGRFAFTRLGGGGTWKRYRGGTAPDIWVGHPDSASYRRITSFEGLDAWPMWHGGRIYYLCDRGGTANIWSMRPDGSDQRPHTAFTDWDIRWPAMGPSGRIVFGLGGDLYLFDPADGSTTLIPLELPSERTLTRVRYPNASAYLTEFSLSPTGDRLAVVSRGEIFSVPVKEGVTLPITRSSGAREHKVTFDPKGERIAYVTDESGEEAIVVADAWGRGVPRRVTPEDDTSWHFPPSWSPDGAYLAYADHTHRLYVVDLKANRRHEVDSCRQSEITEYAWSPDGRWLAYAKTNDLEFGSIFVYDTRAKRSHQVTGWTTNDASPTWDPEGRYLYFLSARTIDPVIGETDFEAVVVNATRPYAILLRKDVPNPLSSRAGFPGVTKAEDPDAQGGGGAKDQGEREPKPPAPVEIDFDGLSDRIVELPVRPGQYTRPMATKKKLFFLSWPLRGIAREEEDPGPIATLMAYDLEEKKARPFLHGVSSYDLAPLASKLAVMRRRGEISVVSADSPPKGNLARVKVSLDGMVVELDPREEWRQIFLEAWRGMRDFYWDAHMHGLDWPAVRDQYAALLPRLATRDDLHDLVAELIGELATSHTYVWGGDRGREVPRHSVGLLGARMRREGRVFRVEHIYRGDPADRVRSPLEEPGVGVREGDYLLAINHEPFDPRTPFEASLVNLANRRIVLTVNSRPDTLGARDVVVTPLRDDQELLYADWVRRNREYVAEKTGGTVGYVHIPDMGGRGLVAFHRWFFPQLDKEGMVIDVRWNGGGFVSQLILARLSRRLISWDRSRSGATYTYPWRVLNGPFVVLTNEHAGSDGDVFPEAVQLLNLAPVIGKRSWGGVIGIRGGRPTVDGGAVTHPEFAWWDRRRGWGLENRGVEPDIEVENLPHDVARGIDAQLDRAIEEVLRLRAARPPLKPDFGPAPDRSRAAYRHELQER